jgi:hypothetical protein
VSTTADDSDFERWLEDISHNPNAPADDPGEVSEDWRRWMRDFFDANGAAPQAQVNRATEEHLLALANNAVAAVLADLQSVTSLRPTVVVDIYDGGVRIAIDGYRQSVFRGAVQPGRQTEAVTLRARDCGVGDLFV